jgi:hypothetical protein
LRLPVLFLAEPEQRQTSLLNKKSLLGKKSPSGQKKSLSTAKPVQTLFIASCCLLHGAARKPGDALS